MNRSQIRNQLEDGLNTVFGLEYKDRPEVWRNYLKFETEGRKAYVEDVMMAGFGAAAVKAEGAPIMYDSTSETYKARYVFETVAMAFAITEEVEEDGLYGSIGKKLSKAMARSYKHTIATRAANLLNNGFSSSYLGGDGVSLFNASHPLKNGGTGSNLLAVAADLSETSIEDLSIQIANTTDDRGLPIDLDSHTLVIPTALRFAAHRILTANGRVGTNYNDPNAIKDMGLFPGGVVIDKRLTDTDAWYITTDASDGLKFIERKAVATKMEGDFETGNMRFKCRGRSIQGWSDWRGAFGTPGG